eukprot:680897-Rhodomonas_salina.2
MQALGHAWKTLTPAGKAIWDGKAKALAGAAGVEVPDVEEETEEEAPAAPGICLPARSPPCLALTSRMMLPGKRNSVEPPKAVEEPEVPLFCAAKLLLDVRLSNLASRPAPRTRPTRRKRERARSPHPSSAPLPFYFFFLSFLWLSHRCVSSSQFFRPLALTPLLSAL